MCVSRELQKRETNVEEKKKPQKKNSLAGMTVAGKGESPNRVGGVRRIARGYCFSKGKVVRKAAQGVPTEKIDGGPGV